MPYLQRRIEKLLSDFKSGKLILRADNTELPADLDAVVVDERGQLDLSTCSERVRSYARAYWGISSFADQERQAEQSPAAPKPAAQSVTAKAQTHGGKTRDRADCRDLTWDHNGGRVRPSGCGEPA